MERSVRGGVKEVIAESDMAGGVHRRRGVCVCVCGTAVDNEPIVKVE